MKSSIFSLVTKKKINGSGGVTSLHLTRMTEVKKAQAESAEMQTR